MTLILSGTDGLSDVDGSAATPAIRGTDANTGIFFPAADTIAFSEGGTEAMRIDASGNMGVGTTPSAWGSTAKAVQLPAGCAIANLGAGDVVVTQNAYFDNPNFKYASTTGVGSSVYRQIDGTHRWSYAASGTAGNNITFTEAMRIDTSGNVGIGTASPYSLGSGFTTVTLNGTGGGGISMAKAGTQYGYVYADNNNLSIQTNTTIPIVLSPNNTERMRIDSSGNLLFNSGYGSVATAYGCRAWVNFNGTGTVAIRGSGNVTSITDNAVGNYTVNFTTAMPDVNYSATCTAVLSSVTNLTNGVTAAGITYATGSVVVKSGNYSTGLFDADIYNVAIFR